MKCENCGMEIKDLRDFCPSCGKRLVSGSSSPYMGTDRDDHLNSAGFYGANDGADNGQFQNMNNVQVKKKKKWPVILIICMIILLLVFGFFWMNSFSEDDAKALVKAELDSDILGKYDEDFDFGNYTREEAKQNHEDTIKALVDSEQDTEGFSDSLRDRTAEMVETALACSQYTVEKAEKQDDGSFVVRVVTKPLDLYAGMDGSFYSDLIDTLAEQYPDEDEDISDNPEYLDSMWSLELDKIIDSNLKNPSYRSEEYNTVSVYQNDDGKWIADADDLLTIENKLLYSGSRWDNLFQQTEEE